MDPDQLASKKPADLDPHCLKKPGSVGQIYMLPTSQQGSRKHLDILHFGTK